MNYSKLIYQKTAALQQPCPRFFFCTTGFFFSLPCHHSLPIPDSTSARNILDRPLSQSMLDPICHNNNNNNDNNTIHPSIVINSNKSIRLPPLLKHLGYSRVEKKQRKLDKTEKVPEEKKSCPTEEMGQAENGSRRRGGNQWQGPTPRTRRGQLSRRKKRPGQNPFQSSD